MTRNKEAIMNLIHKDSPHKVKLGDDYQYPIKGGGEASYRVDSRKLMKIKKVLYVHGLRKNLLPISSLEDKGFRVVFVDGQVLMWPMGNDFSDAIVIRIQEGGLYILKGKSDQALIHTTINPSEILA